MKKLKLSPRQNNLNELRELAAQEKKKVNARHLEDWGDDDFLEYWIKRMKDNLNIPYVPFTRDYQTIQMCRGFGFNNHQIKLMIDYLTSGKAKYPAVKNFYVLSSTYVNFVYQRALKWKMG